MSSNTAVRNNLTSRLYIDTRNSGMTADHNVALCCAGPEFSWYVNGVVQYMSKVGTYTNGNIIDAGGAKAEFVNFNPSTLTYNVLLKSGAQAIGAGTAAGAPTSIFSASSARRPTPRALTPIRIEGKGSKPSPSKGGAQRTRSRGRPPSTLVLDAVELSLVDRRDVS